MSLDLSKFKEQDELKDGAELGFLKVMEKKSPPKSAQKEANSFQKEANSLWPKILISRRWTDDGQTITRSTWQLRGEPS